MTYMYSVLKVEDIESKLDLLIDLYKEDRKILLQHIQMQQMAGQGPGQGQGHPGQGHPLAPPPGPPKPRPILVDKQFTSEPATPTSVGLNPNKPMHRNLSDLSQRIKKRVTYRCLSLNDPPKRPGNKLPLAASLAVGGGGDGSGGGGVVAGSAPHPLACDGGGSAAAPPLPPSSSSSSSDALRPPSPLSAPPLGAGFKTFGDGAAGYAGMCVETNLDDVFAGEVDHKPKDSDWGGCGGGGDDDGGGGGGGGGSDTSSTIHPHPLTSGGHELASSTSAATTTTSSSSQPLSTLNEQRSVESDSSSLAFLDSAAVFPAPTEPVPTAGTGAGKSADSCNGSPPMSTTPTVRIESAERDTGSNPPSARTEVAAVPALESLTDFHVVECDLGKVKSTSC